MKYVFELRYERFSVLFLYHVALLITIEQYFLLFLVAKSTFH